jgi:hypothetical protein
VGGFGFEVGFKKRGHFVAPRWWRSGLRLLAAVPVLVVVRIALVSVVVAIGLRVVRQDVHLLSGCVYGSAGRGVSVLQRDYVEPADRSVDERARRAWGVSARVRVVGLHAQWALVSVGRCSPTCPIRKLLVSGIQAK